MNDKIDLEVPLGAGASLVLTFDMQACRAVGALCERPFSPAQAMSDTQKELCDLLAFQWGMERATPRVFTMSGPQPLTRHYILPAGFAPQFWKETYGERLDDLHYEAREVVNAHE